MVLLAGVIGALIAARALDLGQRLGDLRGFVDGLGAWGPWVFLLIYVVAVVAAVPGLAITVLAGALFGAGWGLLLVSTGSTLGASVSFLIARYFARSAVESWLSSRPRFRRLDEMTERHGALMVIVTRLVPLFPFNLLNYGFGLTRVPFWTYVFWSWLGMLPFTAVYVLGADVAATALQEDRVPWRLLATLVGLLVLALTLAGLARRRLADDASENR